MGGNVTEWVDESDNVTGKDDNVVSLGGYTASDEFQAKCVVRVGGTRDTAYGDTGIRCCKGGPL
jgi:formylglycine-generating enzyme required for sulfatase activity